MFCLENTQQQHSEPPPPKSTLNNSLKWHFSKRKESLYGRGIHTSESFVQFFDRSRMNDDTRATLYRLRVVIAAHFTY